MSTSGITPGGCPYCGSYWHSGMCPRIESIEYHRDGSIMKVTLRDETPVPEVAQPGPFQEPTWTAAPFCSMCGTYHVAGITCSGNSTVAAQ